MFFSETRAVAKLAKDTADESIRLIREHMTRCEGEHQAVKKQLTEQDRLLSDIRSFIQSTMIGVILLLLSALSYMLVTIINHLKW